MHAFGSFQTKINEVQQILKSYLKKLNNRVDFDSCMQLKQIFCDPVLSCFRVC